MGTDQYRHHQTSFRITNTHMYVYVCVLFINVSDLQ